MKKALFAACLALASTGTLSGCVERYILVRSEPVGAQVFIDGFEMGPTPARIPFEHYGTRELMLRHVPEEGSSSSQQLASYRQPLDLSPPWWQVFPLDLVSGFLWPGTLVHEHEVNVTLVPQDYDALEAAWLRAAQDAELPVEPSR